jgi:hypothetical protein
MVEEGKTTNLDENASSSLEEAPPAIEIKAAPLAEVEVPAEPEKQAPESSSPKFLVGLLLPILVLLILTSTSLLSAGAWEFNRRVEVTIQSDDDGVFRFDADPKVSHGVKESVYIIFIDPAYTGGAMAYRPEIHIGVIEDCEVESVNTVCMYHLKQDGNGDLEFTKLGEYDQLNHTAEFVLNGEANESIGLRIDYYDHGAEEHYYEVEQPRNRTIVSVLLGAAFIGVLVYSALKNDGSLLGGVGISVVVIAGLAVLAFVSALLEALSG